MAPVLVDEALKEGPLSLELIIAIVGGSALFVAIVLGFCLVARKKCSVRPFG
ncbi:hypothetical protein OH76DRAFT_1483634 [Lentinus brumalis]|uniref:Uncharacterized protein n=1 Tax=Lentinus brumalis TaxID=2498619 RepID=A0A371D8J0_9APHY|nr:hypothetical protein OH76DRAFT_1483634 [Polyporus brumalis]